MSESLTEQVRAGHVAAYGQLYQLHYPRAWRRSAYFSRNPPEREDLVAQAFEHVLLALRAGGGPDDEGFGTYLAVTIRNLAITRARWRRHERLTEEIEALDLAAGPSAVVLDDEQRRLLVRAVNTLDIRWQTILFLLDVKRRSITEVAELLHLEPNAVSALAYRARRALRAAAHHGPDAITEVVA